MNNSKNNKIKHEIQDDGTEVWKQTDGGHHQNKDVPAIIYPDGTEIYYKNGKRFREFGPETKHPNGAEQWDTKKTYGLHRTDGAAAILPNGEREYHIDEKIVSYDKFRKQDKTRNPR